jgi:hypothetical protein
MPEDLTYTCPFCDHEVRVGKSCKGCAKVKKTAPAKAKRSWEQDKMYDGVDLPDDDFDYDEFVAKEFGHIPHKKVGIKWYWWLLGFVILLLFALGLISAYGRVVFELIHV